MIFLELTRLETSPNETIGVLSINKQLLCYVLEPPKRNNEKNLSCIPTGQYICKRYDSPKFKCPCLQIHNVPGRDYIAVHYGNTAKDTKGCLITGTRPGFINGARAVLQSSTALEALMSDILDICHLTIQEVF